MHFKCGSCISRVLLLDFFSTMCCWMGKTFSRNEFCSFWVTCCLILKEKLCLYGAGLEFAALLGSRGGAGTGQWSVSLDKEHRLVVVSSYSFLFQVVLQPCEILQHPGYEKCQGRRCLWNTFIFIYLLLLHRKRCLRLMFLIRKQIFCFKIELRVF